MCAVCRTWLGPRDREKVRGGQGRRGDASFGVKALRDELNHVVGAPPLQRQAKSASGSMNDLADERKKLAAIQAAVAGA